MNLHSTKMLSVKIKISSNQQTINCINLVISDDQMLKLQSLVGLDGKILVS